MSRRVTFLLITLFFILSGCRGVDKVQEKSNEAANNGSKGELINVVLYYPDGNCEYLIPETRLVSFNKSAEQTVLEEFFQGPGRKELINPIPRGTRLLSIDRKNDMVTINLSKEFIKNHPGGSSGEIMSVYSIVNTLTEIPGIKSVQFKVNGNSYETLVGHLVFNKPFKRDRSLFKRNTAMNPSDTLKAQMTFEKQGNWLEAYKLMSDDENNPDRKYYHDYVKEMEEVAGVGFTDQEFSVGNYTLDKNGTAARVKVNFISKQPDGSSIISDDIFFTCVKIQGLWMVDWLTKQP